MRDTERVEFCSSHLFCINICPLLDLHSRDLMGVYLRLNQWCVCAEEPLLGFAKCGLRIGKAAKCSGSSHAHLENAQQASSISGARHRMQQGRINSVSLDCLLAGHAGQPREGQEHVDHDEGQVEGGEQGGGGGQVEP